MTKLLDKPYSWHKVEICQKCERVICYEGSREGKPTWYIWPPDYDNGHCIYCGPVGTKKDVAAFYYTSTWYLPWTWFNGTWELKRIREQRLAAAKLFEPIRKSSNE